MAERRSPLSGHWQPGFLGPASVADAWGVTLRERRPASMVQVAGWPSAAGALTARLREVTGVAPPPAGKTASGDDLTLLWTAPGRWLAASETRADLAETLSAAVGADIGTVSDLGHARCVFRLLGPMAPSVLAKGLPIDLHLNAFPVDGVVQGSIHHMGVLVHRVAADAFDLYVFRGFAVSLLEWLTDAAAEYSCTVGG
jgi:heterotetrameric sarcosine oxidase gamma subunit